MAKAEENESEERALSGSAAGNESYAKFEAWKASMTNSGYKQIVFRGSLKRGEIAKGCGFAKSVLTQNLEVRKDLEKLEERLRGNGVLPKKTGAKIESDRTQEI